MEADSGVAREEASKENDSGAVPAHAQQGLTTALDAEASGNSDKLNVERAATGEAPARSESLELGCTQETQAQSDCDIKEDDTAEEPGPLLAEGWTEHLAPQGLKYYYNERTKESRWVPPLRDAVPWDAAAAASTGGAQKPPGLKSQKRRVSMLQVEQAVQELSEERRALQSKLSSKDAVLDPRVKDWIVRWLAGERDDPNRKKRQRLERDTDHLIEMLSSGYEGYGENVRLLMKWIDLASGKPGGGSEAATEHFKALALKEFNPDKMQDVVEANSDAPPAWLEGMLESPTWRSLLITLADKHKNVPVLDFCVKAICKAGHHAEVAAVMNTASYFAVFRRTFTDTLSAILEFDASSRESTPAQLTKLEERLRELSGYSQFTYTFAIEALAALEGAAETGRAPPVDAPAPAAGLSVGRRAKIRRLRQGLEAMAHKPDDAAREALALNNPLNRRSEGGLSAGGPSGGYPELASLMRTYISERVFNPELFARLRQIFDPSSNPDAMAAPLWPIRRVEFLTVLTGHLFEPYKEISSAAQDDAAYIVAVAAARGSSGGREAEAEVHSAVSEAVGICKDKDTVTLGGLVRSSEQMKRLEALVVKHPAVAAGTLRFARALFLSQRFLMDSCFSLGVRSLLHLIRCSMKSHPLQRVMVFFTISGALRIKPPHIAPLKLLELKQSMLDELLALMEKGFVFQVLEYMRKQATSGQMDQALLRYFLKNLARIAGGALSPEFAKASLQLINSENCVRAVRSAQSREITSTINEFKLRCSAAVSAAPVAPAESRVTSEPGARDATLTGQWDTLVGSNRNRTPLGVGPPGAATSRRETIRLVPFRQQR